MAGMALTIAGLVVALIVMSLTIDGLTDSERPVQLKLNPDRSEPWPVVVSGIPTAVPPPQPTPVPLVPTAPWRGLATIPAALDTTDGMAKSSGNEYNENPLANLAGYSWVTEGLFHPASRVHDVQRTLTFPGCVGAPGEKAQRYFYAESNTHGALQQFNVGGINQVAAWPKVGTFTTDETEQTFDLYASVRQLDCTVMGGRLVEVYP